MLSIMQRGIVLTSGEHEVDKQFNEVVWDHFRAIGGLGLDHSNVLILKKFIELILSPR